MINSVQAVRSLQAVACIVGLALLLWSIGIPALIHNADAASLVAVSDTLSDSDRGVVSNHTIRFTTPTGAISGQTIVITFPTGGGEFTLPSAGFGFDDIDVTDDGNEITLANSPAGTTWGVATTSSSITFTVSTTSGAAIASSSVIEIEIGTNATGGNNQITNPTNAGTKEIDILGPAGDTGTAVVAIIDDVVVTANVNTTFTFTISGVATSSTVNGGATTTAGSSTATSIPFGTLAAGTTTVMAQDISVLTNATNGFVVTVAQSQNLQSSTGADIDGFANGAYTNTPDVWTAPTRQTGNENTWGHWGLTTEDNLNGDEFGTDEWVAASTTPRQIFEHDDPADGVTPNSGRTRVGYQVEISSFQEAGDDYETFLTYVATPSF
jgi:hypothetical protein